MTNGYRPPRNREEAKERLEKYRCLIEERVDEVGADVARFETVTLSALWDVMKSHEILNKRGG